MMQRRRHRNYVEGTLAALLVIGAGVFLFLFSAPAFAGPLDDIREGIIPKCNWVAGETYGLGAFTQLALNVLKLIWGILGSLALVMFVWGGFLWLTARGEENQIKQGWDTLINAVIGLLIVLGSWLIINTIILALTDPGNWNNVAQVFNEDWTNRVKGDICVRVGAHVKSTGIARGAVGSAATGKGDGVCCLESTFGATFNKRVNEDRCKQLVLQVANSGAQRAKAHYCPSTEDEKVCGDIQVLGGARYSPDDRSGEYWSMKCTSGQHTYIVADKGELCASTDTICKDPYKCFMSGTGKKCIDENEKGKCIVVVVAKLNSDVKKIVVSWENDKTRSDCARATYSNTTIAYNSQNWSVVGIDDIRWCEKDASDGSVWSTDSSSGTNAVNKEFGRWGMTCVSVK